MDRRTFLTSTSAALGAAVPLAAQDYSDYSKDPRPDVAEGTWTAGSSDGPVFAGPPVVSGPAAESITILQPVQRLATGYAECAIGDGPWERVDATRAGMLPLSEHVLKFRLPPLPAGKAIRYRVVARPVGWVKVRQFYHGEFKAGPPQTSDQHSFRTLDPAAETTSFVVWNDTHENDDTLAALHKLTAPLAPDFLLWNGDQSNDVHFERDMAGQFLSPSGMAIADRWPLAYVRGNHDVRGPAALSLPGFTGTPDDRFYYAFRSGPVAALAMDTGEDKPDDSPYLSGMAAFQQMQREQAEWLKQAVQAEWFQSAPHKVLFCHIPLWFKHPRLPNNRFDGTRFCRDLWSPTLVEAGVKLVISGHTHDFVWMPAEAGQPVAQLIGGGPQPRIATLIQVTASRTQLKLRMTKLDGTVVADAVVEA
ncbi:MAG TPA: metallophosphoesterase [Caulifigura sp.]|nr:metallophosphoesterase [Caulifigura sp.]